MKRTLYFITLFCLSLSIWSCSEDELDPVSRIVESQTDENEFDFWLRNNYLEPYNIDFRYRMDYKESDMNYYLVPAELGQSKKIAKLLLYLGIEPYDKVTGGSDFIKANFPKMVNLIGSGGYKNNGTFVLGTAEGGVKITLYFINSLNTFINNIDALNEYYFKTIHHEFGHILHQTVPYSPNFKTISGTDYVSDAWSDKYKGGEDVSLPDGFITPYASNQVDDDFVEMLSVYIVNSPEAWAAKMAKAGSKGRSKLLQKLDILTKYMEETWNIDINALRDEIVSRQANISYINF